MDKETEIVDHDGYQAALRAISRTKSPDRTKSGDWELKQAILASMAVEQQKMNPGMTEEEMLEKAIQESIGANADAGPGPSSYRNSLNQRPIDPQDFSALYPNDAAELFDPEAVVDLLSSDDERDSRPPVRSASAAKSQAPSSGGLAWNQARSGPRMHGITQQKRAKEREEVIDLDDDSDSESEQVPEAGPGPSTTARRIEARARSVSVGAGKGGKGVNAAPGNDGAGSSIQDPVSAGPPAGSSLISLLGSREERKKLEEARRARSELAMAAKQGTKRKRTEDDEESDSSETEPEDDDLAMDENRGPAAGYSAATKRQRTDGPDPSAATAQTLGGSFVTSLIRNAQSPEIAEVFEDDVRDSFKANPKVPRLFGDNGRAERGDMCWKGDVRSTYIASSSLRSSRKVWKIKEVIGDTSELSLVIAASYHWDLDWVQSLFPDPQDVPFVRIIHPQEDFKGQMGVATHPQDFPGSMVCGAVFSNLNFSSMHMKFMLLFYKSGRMRVVISSANMVAFDWESIENITFVQDLMPLDDTIAPPEMPNHEVPRTFRKLFCQSFLVDRALRHLQQNHPAGGSLPLTPANDFAEFGKWDWSKFAGKLVITTPGNHEGVSAVEGVGSGRLAKVLREAKWVPRSDENVVAEYQSSSLHAFSERWMQQFHWSLKGCTIDAIAKMPQPAKRNRHGPEWPPIKVVFPTLHTVDMSNGGRPGGGTMFCNEKQWRPDTKELFYDSNSKKGKVLQHTKMIVATFVKRSDAKKFLNRPAEKEEKTAGECYTSLPDKSPARRQQRFDDALPVELQVAEDDGYHGWGGYGAEGGSSAGGWWYMGSHNFSKAAWGTISFQKTGPKIYAMNYEMGLVFPLPRNDLDRAVKRVSPWFYPSRKYNRRDQPWMQSIHGAQGGAGLAHH